MNNECLYNFISGGIAGGVAGLVSHPFLRMKIDLQNGKRILQENLTDRKWLFKGLRYGVMCYSLEKMFVFGFYNTLLNYDFNNLTAGAIAGTFASIVICPGEKLVIDSINNVNSFYRSNQIYNTVVLNKYNILLKIVKINFRRMYTGFNVTVLREAKGFGVHMAIYGYLTDKYNKECNYIKNIGFVSLSVLCAWSTIVPIDRLKTAIQSPGFCWNKYKFSSSFNGFSFALLRALPFHCTSFSLMYLFKNNKDMILC